MRTRPHPQTSPAWSEPDTGTQLQRLLEAASDLGRDAAFKAMMEGEEGYVWFWFEEQVEALVPESVPDHPQLIIVRCAPYVPGARRDAYTAMGQELCRGLDDWWHALAGAELYVLVRRALLWQSASELLSAKHSPHLVLEVLSGSPAEACPGAEFATHIEQPSSPSPPAAWHTPANTPTPPPTNIRAHLQPALLHPKASHRPPPPSEHSGFTSMRRPCTARCLAPGLCWCC